MDQKPFNVISDASQNRDYSAHMEVVSRLSRLEEFKENMNKSLADVNNRMSEDSKEVNEKLKELDKKVDKFHVETLAAVKTEIKEVKDAVKKDMDEGHAELKKGQESASEAIKGLTETLDKVRGGAKVIVYLLPVFAGFISAVMWLIINQDKVAEFLKAH